jgi:hypothetical protein
LTLISEPLSILDGLVESPLIGHLVKNLGRGIAHIQQTKT